MTLPSPPDPRAVNSAAQHGGAAFKLSAPRQAAGEACAGALALGGVSAFAFQGTNAHAVMARHTPAGVYAAPTSGAAWMAAAAVQRVHTWVLPPAHPLAAACLPRSARSAGVTFECCLVAPRLALFADHAVFGRVLFPAAGMLEAALAAGATALDAAAGAPSRAASLAIAGMSISQPLVIAPPSRQRGGGAVMRCSLTPHAGEFSLSHADAASSKTSTENARGCFAAATATAIITGVQLAAAAAVRTAAVKRALLGRLLQAAANGRAGAHATGSIVVPASLQTDNYIVPPPCMDACFHLGVAAPGCGAKVPIAVGAFGRVAAHNVPAGAELLGGTSAMYLAPAAGSVDVASFALTACSTAEAFAGLADLQAKVVRAKAEAPAAVQPADFLYEMDWESPAEPASQLEQLQGAAVPCQQAAALAWADGGGAPMGEAALQLCGAPEAVTAAALELVQHAQSVQAGAVAASLPEVLVGRGPGGRARGVQRCLLAAGAVEGLLRVAATEHAGAEYSLRTADLQHDHLALPVARVGKGARGTLSTTRACGGAASHPRLRRARAQAPGVDLVQILPVPRGSLSSLTAQPLGGKHGVQLRPHEVLVAVRAVGINFRDVLNVLGMYPGDPGPPGSDCAGVVMRVGSAVRGLRPGDPVFGLAHGCLGSAVVAPAATLAPMPCTLSFSEAASTPTVFITVDVALHQSAAMRASDRVLVHAAAGGVGLAALQVIQAAGAEAVATAGGAAKRSLLHGLGVRQVLGSRDTAFSAEAAQLGGVDVVLNSLTSAGMVAGSLAALRRGGRMVEISKRDIWSAARVAQGERRCVVSASLVLGPP